MLFPLHICFYGYLCILSRSCINPDQRTYLIHPRVTLNMLLVSCCHESFIFAPKKTREYPHECSNFQASSISKLGLNIILCSQDLCMADPCLSKIQLDAAQDLNISKWYQLGAQKLLQDLKRFQNLPHTNRG